MRETRSGAGTIAVIVPVYNNEETVQRCIDSVLGQTFEDLELVLVDDGSRDRSGVLCDAAAAGDGRVRVVHKENGGLTSAWISGVRSSSAPYLAFVDGDDWIEKDLLEKLAGGLEDAGDSGAAGAGGSVSADAPWQDSVIAQAGGGTVPPRRRKEIVCSGYVVDREWNGTSEPHDNGAAPGVYEGEALRSLKNDLLGHERRAVIASRCMKLFSRELIEDNLPFCDPSIRMGEDLVITTPAILDAERIVLLDGVFGYHYIYYQSSMVHAYDPGLYDNIVKVRLKLLEILMAKRAPDALERTEREYLFLMCIEMKNELRCTIGPSEDVIGRIQDICAAEHTGELVQFYPEKLTDPANRVIVWMLRNPGSFRVRAARRIFLLQQKRNG